MIWWEVLALSLAVLFSLLFSGMAVFVAFMILNLAGVFLLFGFAGFGMFANSLYETATNPGLITVPLFVLMGEILFRSGTVEVLFKSVDTLIGRVRGRLYVLVVALSTVFGALCGSAVAVTAMLGRSVLPMMESRGYDVKLSMGTIVGGASLAPIIPPSMLVIIVGSLVKNVSIANLLIAGVLPGLILAVLLLGYVFLRVFWDQDLAPVDQPRPPGGFAKEAFWAVIKMVPFSLIIFSVMGLILMGIATPSESAATGVFGSLLAAAVFRRLSFSMVKESLLSAAKVSSVILIIIGSAKMFSQLLSFTGATQGLVNQVIEMELSGSVMLLFLMAIPFFLCMFIDWIAFMLLAIPLYEPLLAVYNYDPLWFWMLFLINLTVGSLTPPFGYTLFAMKGAAPEVPIGSVFVSAWPVVAIFLAGMFCIALFPSIVVVLPNLLF